MTPSGGLGHVLQKEKIPLACHKFKQLVYFIENDNFTENFIKSYVLTKTAFIEMIIFFRICYSLWQIGIT